MENKTRAQIVIACFAGAFIGALIGLTLKAYGSFLWIPSALVGGLVAYLTYDLRAVGAACRRAWREVSAWRLPPGLGKKSAEISLVYLLLALGATSVLFEICFPVALLLSRTLSVIESTPLTTAGLLLSATYALILSAIIGMIVTALPVIATYVEYSARWPNPWPKELSSPWRRIKMALKFIALTNPIAFPFVGCYWSGRQLWKKRAAIGRGMARLAQTTFRGVKTVSRFIARIFVLIHSDVRTLCFVDAAIGATIGYFAGSALIGGLVGAAWGLLNYEIISVRILKISPAHVRR